MKDKNVNDKKPEEQTFQQPDPQGFQPEQPFTGYGQMPFNPYMMQGYMPYAPYPPYPPQYQLYQPYGYPVYGPPQAGYQQECGHHQQDPFGGMFGMFSDMINNNPQLSAVGKMVESTGSDFLKGLVIGAGIAMLLSSDTMRTALSDILGKSVNMFSEEEEKI